MPQTFAQRLRDARKEAGYPSLESLAVKVGCVKQTLSNIEKGLQAEVKMLLLYELADTLHVSPPLASNWQGD